MYEIKNDIYTVKKLPRVANSHAYGVNLTHLTCYSRTHAIDKITHAIKKNARILQARVQGGTRGLPP